MVLLRVSGACCVQGKVRLMQTEWDWSLQHCNGVGLPTEARCSIQDQDLWVGAAQGQRQGRVACCKTLPQQDVEGGGLSKGSRRLAPALQHVQLGLTPTGARAEGWW